jgi:hypothetical protein
MFRNKMTLSILAFAGSILLFVAATFAWITFEIFVEVDPITKTVVNIDASAGLEVSTDGIEYDVAQSVVTQNRVPGDIVYYRLEIDNTGDVLINLRIQFQGFLSTVNDPLKDDTNFENGMTLVDIIRVSATNSLNSDEVDNLLMSDLIGPLPIGVTYENASLLLFNGIPVPVGTSVVIIFTFTISETAGNDYQNLKLSIDNIIVDAIQE